MKNDPHHIRTHTQEHASPSAFHIQSRRISLYFIFLLFKHFCVLLFKIHVFKKHLYFSFYFISYTSPCMHKHLKNLILVQHSNTLTDTHTRTTHHFFQKCVQLFEDFHPMAIFSFFSFIFIFIVCCQVEVFVCVCL